MKFIGLTLASGSGSRLHPISSEERPKQFIPLLDPNEMMVNTTNKRLKKHVDHQYTVTLKKYQDLSYFIDGTVLFEPQRMETGFSVLYSLLSIQADQGDCYIIQTPSDHYIGDQEAFDEAIFKGLQKLSEADQIVMIGEAAVNAETDYGYILDHDKGIEFIEKPDKELAIQLSLMGAYWNTAIYIYPIRMMLDLFHLHKREEVEALYFSILESFDSVAETYNCFEPFSFEKEILQRSKDLSLITSFMEWDDIGSLDRLKKVRGEDGWKKIKTNTGIDQGS